MKYFYLLPVVAVLAACGWNTGSSSIKHRVQLENPSCEWVDKGGYSVWSSGECAQIAQRILKDESCAPEGQCGEDTGGAAPPPDSIPDIFGDYLP